MPLQPAGFDPMNVTSLSKKEILHRRFLRLENSSSSLEVMNRKSLSEGCGEHPLFNGVCKLIVAGFSSKPSVFESEGKVVIKSEGFTAEFEKAQLEIADKALKVTLTEQKYCIPFMSYFLRLSIKCVACVQHRITAISI
jgi:hypothetical protein